MACPSIVHSHVALELKSSPINPSWILDGTPEARNAVLSRSQDGTAVTLVWDCTPGKFEWFYDEDETIHILEGSVSLDDGKGSLRQIGPGDVVFFPAGSHAVWTVERHVRKLAFFRRTLPTSVGLLLRAAAKMRSVLRASEAAKSAPKQAFALRKAG